MRVFITGATGVLGRYMVRQFLDEGHTVVGLARDEKARNRIRLLGGEAVAADIFETDALASAVGQAVVVVTRNGGVFGYRPE